MKQHLPYNILLAVALVVTGAMVLYNLGLRDSFALSVSYYFPPTKEIVAAEETQNSPALDEPVVIDPGQGEDHTVWLPLEEEGLWWEPLEDEAEEEGAPAEESKVAGVSEAAPVYDVEDDYEDDADTGGGTTTVYFPLELNSCTVEELKFIPRVGDVTAQRIVQYRDVLGGYTDLTQLMEIKGIGKSTYEHISAYLYVEGDAWDLSH